MILLYRNERKKFSDDTRFYAALFALGFLAIFVLYLWRAPLDIQAGEDEAFWIVTTKRLVDGDALFKQEWFVGQMWSFLQYPFVKLHMMLFGTEGIYLHFRYLGIALSALCAIVIYVRLRSYKLAGVAAALFTFFHVEGNIMALGYTATSIKLMTLTCTLLATAGGVRPSTASAGCCLPLLCSARRISSSYISCSRLCCLYIAPGAEPIAISVSGHGSQRVPLRSLSCSLCLFSAGSRSVGSCRRFRTSYLIRFTSPGRCGTCLPPTVLHLLAAG